MSWRRTLSIILSVALSLSLITYNLPATMAEGIGSTSAAAEPTVEATLEPTAEVTLEPTAEATLEPAAEATLEPAAEATLEPAAEATLEPAAEATLEPTAESILEPTEEATLEPTEEATLEPTEEAAIEPLYGVTKEPDSGTITSQLTCTIKLDKSTVAVGETITASWSISGGTAPYVVYYWWEIEEADSSISESFDSGLGESGSVSYTPVNGIAGTFRLRVVDASDDGTYANPSEFAITGEPTVAPISCTIQLDRTTVAVGSSINGAVTATGGVAPYQYAYSWIYTESNGSKHSGKNESNALPNSSYSPQYGLSGYLSVTVTDASGRYKVFNSSTFLITGAPEPITCTLQLDKTTVAVGSPIIATWAVSGGVAPYQYAYTWFITETNGGKIYSNGKGSAAQATYTPLAGSSGYFGLAVTDANGTYRAFYSQTFMITGAVAAELLSCTFSFDKDPVAIGDSITASWTAAGGTAPYTYVYRWHFTDSEEGNSWTTASQNTTTAQACYALEYGNSGYIKVDVSDSVGRYATFTSQTFVIKDRFTCSVSLNKSTVAVGGPITATWSVTGGTQPYSYAYEWTIEEANGETQTYYHEGTSTQSTCTPLLGVKGYITVWVYDAEDYSKRFSSEDFVITGAVAVDPIDCTITLDQSSVKAGNPIKASWAVIGGTAPYSYEYHWSFADANGEEFGDWDNTTLTWASYTPYAGVSGQFMLYVTDALGRNTRFDSDTFTITGAPDPLSCMISFDKTTVKVGNTITATWTVTGGTAPYTYYCEWEIEEANGDRNSYGYQDQMTAAQAMYTPLLGVKGHIWVSVRDANGYSMDFSSDDFEITGAVAVDPLDCTITLDKSSVKAGDPIKSTWVVTGGTAPYSYRYYWSITDANGDDFNDGGNTALTWASYTPYAGVSGSFELYVTDALGRRRSFDSNMFTITGAPDPLSCTITFDKTTVKVGNPITATWTVTGGIAPYTYYCEWEIEEANGENQSYDYQGKMTTAQSTYTPLLGVKGHIWVSVHDVNGYSTEFSSDDFEITGAVAADALGCTITLNKSSVAVGSTITANWTATGGTAPYTYSYWWSATESDGNDDWSGSETTQTKATYSPRLGVKGHFELHVTDALGRGKWFVSDTFTITGAPSPVSCKITLNQSSVAIGKTISATWTTTGGTAPYKYGWDWVVSDSASGSDVYASSAANRLSAKSSFTPRLGDSGYLEVTVTDATGRTRSFESDVFEITGAAAVEDLACSVKLDKTSAAIGTPITATVTASGGTAPYRYTYDWEFYDKDGNYTTDYQSSKASVRSFVPLTGVYGVVTVNTYDALNRHTSASASFSITGTPTAPLACEIKLDKSTVAVGSKISATWTASGGTAPYSYAIQWAFWEGDNPNGYAEEMSKTDSASSSNSPTAGTIGRLIVEVTDARGISKNFWSDKFTITGAATVKPLACTITLDKSTVAINKTISATWKPSGGTAPYTYTCRWIYIDTDGKKYYIEDIDTTATSGQYAPPAGVRGYLQITMNDSKNRTEVFESDEFTITGAVAVDRLACTVTLNKSTVAVGTTVNATWAASGGTKPYTYEYTWILTEANGGTITMDGEGTAAKSSYTPKAGVTGYLSVTVNDAVGRAITMDSASFAITGGKTANPLVCAFKLNKTSVPTGQAITSITTATGGTTPYSYKYVWSVTEASGKVTQEKGTSTSATFSFTPTKGVRGTLSVTVVDACGRQKTLSAKSFTVTEAILKSIVANDLVLGVDQTVQIAYQLLPAGATSKTITFTSANKKIATVDAKGNVKGVKVGSTNVTITADGGVKTTIKVTVKAAPKSVSLKVDRTTLGVGETAVCTVTLPKGSAGSWTFTTSNAEFATVDEDGKITAVGVGTATITVKAYNGKKATAKITVKAAPTGVSLSPNALSVGVGGTEKLSVTLSGGGAGAYVFATSDSKIATVDASGNVKGIKKGEATITVTTFNGKKATCKVTVADAPMKLTLTADRMTLGVGEKLQLNLAILPTGAAGTPSFKSSKTTVVVVSSTGLMTAKKAGTAIITATMYNGVKATIKVTVKAAPKNVSLKVVQTTLGVGETAICTATLSKGSVGSWTFATSDANIATVDVSGKVNAVGVGVATITVKTHNGKKATAKITVKAAPTGVSLSPNALSVGVGGTEKLGVTLSGGSAGVYTFATSDSKIATVDASGNVKGVKKGAATITVTTYNGKKATCKVTVADAPTKLTLTADRTTLGVGEKLQLNNSILPTGAAGTPTFKSSKTSVATVSATGLVTAKKSGMATITATMYNGVKASVKITVKKAPSKVTAKVGKSMLEVGESTSVTVKLSSGSAGAWTYYSSNESIAKIDEKGVVTGVGAGTATITVKTYNGKKATVRITVK